jgi:hypothetical protein
MQIIIDKRIPDSAKAALSRYGRLIEFESDGVVYDAVSGHPDIFLCQSGDGLIIAPNSPDAFINVMNESKIGFTFGNHSLGAKYPRTGHYNAVVTDRCLIHNLKITDAAIPESNRNKIHIHTNQAYTRCNLIALNNNHFITSDKGIEKALKRNRLNVLYVEPKGIELKGFKNGFFGGCCGVHDNKLFIIGSLKHYASGDFVREFTNDRAYTIIELYDGPLVDGGGIFFVKP